MGRGRQAAGFMLAACAVVLISCGGDSVLSSDGAPKKSVSPGSVKDARPRSEPLSRYGNHTPYTVNGQVYHVLPTAEGYERVGIASWYGTKFHGRLTSSGEPFDMYEATAAHRSLPLPTYARVTNLENGRKVVVKINDRGPFKSTRIIDLSYGAAVKLGMIETGTARVRVEAITFAEGRADKNLAGEGEYLQAGAFSNKDLARQLVQRLEAGGVDNVSLRTVKSGGKNLYRVWIGPFKSEQKLNQNIAAVLELGIERPHRVSR